MSTQYCSFCFFSKHNVWLKYYLQLLAVERENNALALQLRSRDSYLFKTSLTSYPLGDFRPQSGSGAGVPAFAFGNPPLRRLGPAIRKPDSQIFDSWFKSIIWIRTEKQMPLVNIPQMKTSTADRFGHDSKQCSQRLNQNDSQNTTDIRWSEFMV